MRSFAPSGRVCLRCAKALANGAPTGIDHGEDTTKALGSGSSKRAEAGTVTHDSRQVRESTAVAAETEAEMVLDGKYRLERLLGEGGMGAVYQARHLHTTRTVALKIIVPRFAQRADFIERFRREAKAAGSLRHPNIVDVTDFGFATLAGENVAYLVMEFLDGSDLAALLRQEDRLPLAIALDVFEQTCAAIEAAHRRGILHRDLKPANIWLEPNSRGGFTVKVFDFGLAKFGMNTVTESSQPPETSVVESATGGGRVNTGSLSPNDDSSRPTALFGSTGIDIEGSPATLPEEGGDVVSPLTHRTEIRPDFVTQPGSVMGSPVYMAPEQCLGQPTGTAADIYSLGVIAYELLSGERPFKPDSLERALYQTVHEAPTSLLVECRDLPKAAASLVMSALDKDPSRRPKNAAVFASTLRARAETVGPLTRRVVAVGTEHFRLFFELFLLAFGPLYVIRTLTDVGFAMAPLGAWSRTVGWFVTPVLTLAGAFFSASIARGASAAVLARLLIAPLRSVRLCEVIPVIRQRLGALLRGGAFNAVYVAVPVAAATNLLAMTVVAAGVTLADMVRTGFHISSITLGGVMGGLVLIGITSATSWVAIRNATRASLLPAALLIENKHVLQAMDRSILLVKGVPGIARAIALAEIALYTASAMLRMLVTIGCFALVDWNIFVPDPVVLLAAFLVTFLLEAFAAPFIAILYAVLYLKARQASGESLNDIQNEQAEHWVHRPQLEQA